jgi:hypothetical protein
VIGCIVYLHKLTEAQLSPPTGAGARDTWSTTTTTTYSSRTLKPGVQVGPLLSLAMGVRQMALGNVSRAAKLWAGLTRRAGAGGLTD